MKIIGYNASPRKDWNTARLLEETLNGAAAKGADTEQINLYDLDFKGCTSCFACKKVGGKSYGKCAMQDDLTLLLDHFSEANAAVFGSPIYFGNVTGVLRCFLERLWFPNLIYTKDDNRSLFSGNLDTVFVYTMNAPEAAIKMMKLDEQLSSNERISKMLFHGTSQSYYCTETLQFDDYSKYVSDMFNVEERKTRYKEIFPNDLKNVYTIGSKLVEKDKH